MKKNPFQNRDLGVKLLWPKLSWSSMSCFTYTDRYTTQEQAHEKWYKQYVQGIKDAPTPSMIAGQIIGEKLATDPKYLPEVPRPEIYEYEIETQKFGKIILTGHMDGFSPTKNELLEYKTTMSKVRWTKETVLDHGQLDFYCLLLFLKHGIKPEELKIRLISIPVIMNGDFKVERSKELIQIIQTTRSMMDILDFGVKVKRVYAKMEEFIHKHA